MISSRAGRFKWNPTDRYWWRLLPADAFDFEKLGSEPWAKGRVAIEVMTRTASLAAQAKNHRIVDALMRARRLSKAQLR